MPKTRRLTVYLAGPIDFVSHAEARDWRDVVTGLNLFDVFDPMSVAQAVALPSLQRANDSLLAASDGVLVRIDPNVVSWGTPYEVAIARQVHRLPMVFITNTPDEELPLYYRDVPASHDPKTAAEMLLRLMQEKETAAPMLHAGGGVSAPALPGDVGYDLCVLEETVVRPVGMGWTRVPIGDESGQLRLAAAPGTWITMAARSSLVMRGLMVANTVIDEGYRGPVFAFAATTNGEPMVVQAGQRIAQVLVMPAVVPPLEQRARLPETARGENGFGSTGA